MVTEEPGIDPFDPYFAMLVAGYDEVAFPTGIPEDFEAQVGAAYNDFFKRPYVCKLIADVMSGRWQLGTSQEEIAEQLGGANRSWVSHSLRRGRLTLDLYMRLRCCPTRPADWEPSVEELRSEMGRSAFIGVARFLAGFIRNRPLLDPSTFDELDYELMCEMIAEFETWFPLSIAGRQSDAAWRLVRNVSNDPARNVRPAWYTGSMLGEVDSRIKWLTNDRVRAGGYLTRLEQNWMGVIAKTFHSLMQVKWRQP
jgi:hypothetical protein